MPEQSILPLLLHSTLFFSVSSLEVGGFGWVSVLVFSPTHGTRFDLAGFFFYLPQRRTEAFLLREKSRRMWGPSPQWPDLHKLSVREQHLKAAVVNNNKIAPTRMMSKATMVLQSDKVSTFASVPKSMSIILDKKYIFMPKNSFGHSWHNWLFPPQPFARTRLQLSRNPTRERGREKEGGRGPRPWGNHIQFSETADMIHRAFSFFRRLLLQERCTYRAKDCICLIVCCKKKGMCQDYYCCWLLSLHPDNAPNEMLTRSLLSYFSP